MAGRHAVDEQRADDFWAYLDRWTLRTYARDFFTPGHDRSIIGVICGVLFIGAGVVRMVVHPGWQSLGVIFVGSAIAVLSFLFPLLLNLAFAYSREFITRLKRPRGRGRR